MCLNVFKISLLFNYVCSHHVNVPASVHTKMSANTCISYDSSTNLTSWPVTSLFNFMTCNDFKYFNEKTYQQILQNSLNAT